MNRQKVTGIGGIFFKSADPARLHAWYRDNLGIEMDWEHGHSFLWKDDDSSKEGMTVWSIFPSSSTYMEPGTSNFMVNYRVRDLHLMLSELRAAGVTVDEKVEESEFGKFGWVVDPDGNKVELWEPPSS